MCYYFCFIKYFGSAGRYSESVKQKQKSTSMYKSLHFPVEMNNENTFFTKYDVQGQSFD